MLAVTSLVEANAGLMMAQGLANCTWALSKLVPTYKAAASCLDTLAVHIMDKLDAMQPQHLSNVMLAWGHLEQCVLTSNAALRVDFCVDGTAFQRLWIWSCMDRQSCRRHLSWKCSTTPTYYGYASLSHSSVCGVV